MRTRGLGPASFGLALAANPDLEDCSGSARLCRPWNGNDRRRAATYAIKWAHRTNYPSYGSRLRNDCTAFVSQALRAGGASYMGEFQNDDDAWWSRLVPRGAITSPSWRLVGTFATHEIVTGRAKFLLARVAERPERWLRGDVLVFNWGDGGSNWDHMAIVTSTGNDPKMAQHTTDRENILWSAQKENLREYVRERGADPDGWSLRVLRPRYKAADIGG